MSGGIRGTARLREGAYEPRDELAVMAFPGEGGKALGVLMALVGPLSAQKEGGALGSLVSGLTTLALR